MSVAPTHGSDDSKHKNPMNDGNSDRTMVASTAGASHSEKVVSLPSAAEEGSFATGSAVDSTAAHARRRTRPYWKARTTAG